VEILILLMNETYGHMCEDDTKSSRPPWL